MITMNTIVLTLTATILIWFVATQCCIYTAIATHTVLSTMGYSPVYCMGWVEEVDGVNHYHAWVRLGDRNIEQAFLNLRHSKKVDYENPVHTFNTTNAFTNRVDMWSPIRMW